MIQGRILLCHIQSLLGQVCQGHLGILHPAGNGQTNTATAAAQIQYPGVLIQEQALADGQLGHSHGIIPGDQHIRRDHQVQAVEFPFSQDIGKRLSIQQPVQPLLYFPEDFCRGIQIPVQQQGGNVFSGDMGHQLLCHHVGNLCFLAGKQCPAGIQKQITISLYQRSAPSSSGSTASTAAMATSIMESSGSLVVKFCSHMPGADRARVKPLSWRPQSRLIS